MGAFTRKLKRKQIVAARKQFMKDFKKSMKQFKKQVKCSTCSRPPHQGENIDNWHIDQESNNIDLICTDCYHEEEVENV
tara:strand:- start:185 stop:421 length:237 start_codon:yes stop_codon:yes gene_type:complete